MTIKNRTDLKSYFVKNAVPTEGNFADLIDSQLNQAQDGVFKPDNEALSVVAAPGDQKRVLRLYANYPAANPDWMIAVNPAQDPATAGTSRAGFGVTDGAGKTKLFIDAATGRIGVGTNNPQVALDVVGGVQGNGFRGRYDLVLNDYRTVNPASNVCLQSPPGDRDAWIYRDVADAASNWGIYHRQIDSAVSGLPGNAIAFVGGGTSKLQAYVNLVDGSGFFAGGLSIQGLTDMSATSNTWNGWLEALRFSRPEHSAITHPGGKLLFGMHSDRNFYFADTSAGRYLATISPANGGSLGIGTNGAPERPFHVHSSLADWQARFQNDSATANVYLAHGGGYGMHVRTDTSAPNNYLLQLYNATLGGSLFYVATSGDTSIAKTLTVSGVINAPSGMIFEGAVAHIDRDGSIYRNTDGQCYITVDDNLYIRDSGSGANWAAHFDTNGGHLELKGTLFTPRIQLGNKWVLSAVGDAQGLNDDWLRMLGVGTPNYYGGLAASKLWSSDGHVQSSDLALKTDIAPLSGALDKVLALRGVTFQRRDLDDGKTRVGLVAQEVERVFPELVSTGPSGERGIQYAGLVAPLIEAVKELHAEVVRLRELRER